MAICINKSAPEWKALVKAVGEVEATRDYLETGGKIRTVQEVQNKLDGRKNFQGASQMSTAYAEDPEVAKVVFEGAEVAKEFQIHNSIKEFDLFEDELRAVYDNYVKLMSRKRKGKEIPYRGSGSFKSVSNNLPVFKHKDTYIFGEWDPKNNIFKARLISSPNIRELFEAVNLLTYNVDFAASVPEDMGRMLDKLGMYKMDVGRFYDFKGEGMIKNMYFSNEELVEKIFGVKPSEVTEEQFTEYDKFYNYRALIGTLTNTYNDYTEAEGSKKSRLRAKLFSSLKEIGIYDYNAFRLTKKLTLNELTDDDLRNVVDQIKKNASLNRVTIDKTDIINDPALYNKLDTELNKLLARYLSKFGFKTEFLSKVQAKLGIDSFQHTDLLSKIITTDAENQTDYPQQAGTLIAYMMQHNPLVSEIMGNMKKFARYKNLSKDEMLSAVGDLIANELHQKTGTKVPETLIEKVQALITQFLNYVNNIRLKRINRNIGYIADNILLENQSLITASTFKPGAQGKPLTKVDFKNAIESDPMSNSIIDKMVNYFILTGSVTLAYQGSVYRPAENQMHDLDWISPYSREESIRIFEELFPNNAYIRHISSEKTEDKKFSEDVDTDTWLVAPEGYSIVNLELEGDFNKVVGYDIIDQDGNVVSSYVPQGDTHTNLNVQAKLVDIFSYRKGGKDNFRYKEIELTTGKKLKIAGWRQTFKAKLDFGRLKDIWDYNRYIPSENIFKTSEGLIGQAALHDAPRKALTSLSNDNAQAIDMANSFAAMLGVDYQIITAEEARALTANAKNPWSGQRAFFFGGQVYFVGDKLSSSTVFHEFSHPVIRHIAAMYPDNFNKLYTDALNTDTGAGIYYEVLESGEYPENSIRFMEEVIVKAMQRSAEMKTNNFKQEPAFVKFMKNLLYRIKQALRNIFGKDAKVSDLSETTTVNELTDMLLAGGIIEINTDYITDTDIVSYESERQEYVKDITNIKNEDLQQTINRFYKVTRDYIDTLLLNKNYEELAEILVDKDKRPDFLEIKGDLAAYQKRVINLAELAKEDINDLTKKSTALVNALFRLETAMGQVLNHIEDIHKEGDTPDNMRRAYYYNDFLDHYQNFINEALAALDSNEVDTGAPIRKTINNINTNIRKSKNLIQEMYKEGSVEVIYDTLLPIHEDIQAELDEKIQKLIDKGAPNSVINRRYSDYWGMSREAHKRYKELSKRPYLSLTLEERKIFDELQKDFDAGNALSKGKLERMLTGQSNDANWFNSYLEGYMYNTDPIVGGLATYIKNNLNEVLAGMQSLENDFTADILPEMKKLNINFRKPGDLGNKLGFADTVAKYNSETGELEERKVLTFLNRYKDYRYHHDILRKKKEEAEERFSQVNSTENELAMNDARMEFAIFKKTYMQQEYVNEYYERYDLLEKDDIGKMAFSKRNEILDEIRAHNATIKDEHDMLAKDGQAETLWKRYRQLHSLYYPNGDMKKDIPEKGIFDLSIAKRLQEYSEASKKFHEWRPRKGVFENTLKSYEEDLMETLEKSEWASEEDKLDMFNAYRDRWIQKNMRVAVKQEYYDKQNSLIEKINEIYDKVKSRPDVDTDALKDPSGLYKRIFNLTQDYRDDNGQIDASQMPKKIVQQVKDLQRQIKELNTQDVLKNGLTPDENKEYSELINKKNNDKANWTADDQLRLNKIFQTINLYGLNALDKARLDDLRSQLADLSVKIPTEAYVDILENKLSKVDLTDDEHKKYFEMDQEMAQVFLEDTELIEKLREENEEFDKWFDENHFTGEYYDKELGEVVTYHERVYVYNITKPADDSYYEKYEIINKDGEVEVLDGLPKLRFYNRVVKEEYKNERIIGKSVDNKGHWLPKTPEQGAKDPKWDDRFINKEYFELEKRNPDMFNLLEKMKTWHLKIQEGVSNKGKLYLDFPRFRKSNLEILQTTSSKDVANQAANAVTIYAKRSKEFVYGAKDDAADGYNDEDYLKRDNMNIVRLDTFDNDISKIPVHGLFDIDIDDVSEEITLTMMRYAYQAERQKQLIKISPQVRGIQSLLQNNDAGIKQIGNSNIVNTGMKYTSNKNDSVRLRAVNNLIEREFEGQRLTGAMKDQVWLNNTANLLFKRASFGFFALNIPSALKNSYGQKFQALIHASGGRDFNHFSLQKGNAWAYATMGELSFGGQLYKKGPKSLNQQIVQLWDPSQGRYLEKLGEGPTRTFGKDLASMSWLYNFRKWVELQATLQAFAAMMYHKKIKRFEGTPDEIEIDYMDAWEIKDGKIQLKEGIDPKWGVTYDSEGKLKVGKEFNKFKNKIHQKMNDMQGAYAQFDQPEAQRYLMFRFLSYLRRYFTTMVMNRFGFSGRWHSPKPRLNHGAGELQMGYYIEFLRLAKATVTDLGRNLMYMTPEEKSAALKVITEVGLLAVTGAAMGLLFGWDPDDEERFEKLRAKSGAFPWFPFVAEDPDRPFNGWGFLENHALFLLMNIEAENKQFLPFPGYGLDDYTALLDLKSIAFGPTVNTYKVIFEDLLDIVEGNDKVRYSREVGPYEWQQKGGNKLWAHIGTTVGLTGSSIDGAKAIQGLTSAQARAKR